MPWHGAILTDRVMFEISQLSGQTYVDRYGPGEPARSPDGPAGRRRERLAFQTMTSRRLAAVFDLDRTIVPTSSARVFQRHMVEAGLASTTGGAVSELFLKAFDIAGENGFLMRAARFAPRSATGWNVERTVAAAEKAAADLVDEVLPYAHQLLAEHKAAGRVTVLATTSPDHLVRPLAERLGIDDVVATRWEIEDGHFTGELASRLVWRRGKLASVKEWAAEHGVDLKRSWAYSDSWFDAPLLASVAHPHAVNPDPRMAALALLRGWPIRYLDKPPGVIKIAGLELQDFLRPFARPELIPNARVEISGLENIPTDGPALIVGNHRSYFDPLVMSTVIARSGRNARYLGKKEVFDVPLMGTVAKAAGGIRVDRATGSDEPLEAAAEALRAGDVVMMMPQGTIPRGPAFFDPELKGRWGVTRLAAMTHAPVIPVGLWGTEAVWPRSSRLPKLTFDRQPLVTATVGPPVDLRYRSADADTKRIMAALVDLLPAEARVRREPTLEELMATFPPGYDGDPTKEDDRRPGTDT